MGNLHDPDDKTPFTKRHRGRRRLRDLLDAMAARRRRGKTIDPVAGYPITFPYRAPGPYAYGYHTGEDHACPEGTRIQAVSYGKVLAVGYGIWGSPYGYQVVCRTKDGKYDYAYCHLSHIGCEPGDSIVPGVGLGKSGATGNVTGPHVHFEARPAGGHYGSDVNPIRVKRKK